MKANNNITPQYIIEVVAKDPSATASTLYDYFIFYNLGEPDEGDYKEFQKKLKTN